MGSSTFTHNKKLEEVYMKLTERVVLCMLLLVILSVSLTAVETPRADVLMAAREGLGTYLPLILSPEDLGTGKIQLGYGFAEYTVDPDRLLQEMEVPLWEKARPTGAWRFVVLFDGNPIALLTVDFMDGRWQTVGIGAAQLAEEVQSVTTSWPEESGFKHRFIRIYQANADFMEIQKDREEPRYTPLIAARVSLQIQGIESGPYQRLFQSEIVEPLREIVLNAMEKNKTNTMMEMKEK
jgi:hypothetical protein